MGKSLNEIAQELKDSGKKVQLIYAFNGTGKTRLSREFKDLVSPKSDTEEEDAGLASKKIIYYNAFTEDLFYWDNDLVNDIAPKLKIQPNDFTHWVFVDQGQDGRIIERGRHDDLLAQGGWYAKTYESQQLEMEGAVSYTHLTLPTT